MLAILKNSTYTRGYRLSHEARNLGKLARQLGFSYYADARPRLNFQDSRAQNTPPQLMNLTGELTRFDPF